MAALGAEVLAEEAVSEVLVVAEEAAAVPEADSKDTRR